MHIREYQEWLEAWDKARGWERVSAAQTFVHASEEMGEVARLVSQWEGYKPAPDPEIWRAEMAEELSDVLVFLFKLAYQCGIDMEDAVRAGQAKADRRYPGIDNSRAELEHYRQRQAELRSRLIDSDEPTG